MVDIPTIFFQGVFASVYDPTEKKKKRKNLKSGPELEGNNFVLLVRDGGPHKSKFVAILRPSFVVLRDPHSVESHRKVPSFPE